ncbi:unnamed protein product [Amoebophrya sp. A25]|nr:unnamed protein product [Amoebophrya sp. A25]|eukprot:GSA25T00022206001.1
MRPAARAHEIDSVTAAAAHGEAELALQLLRRGFPVEPDARGSTALHYAAFQSDPGFLELVRLLLGLPPNAVEDELVEDAAKTSSTPSGVPSTTSIGEAEKKKTHDLLFHRNELGETACHWAVKAGNVAAMRWLIRADAGILCARDSEGLSPLIMAAQLDHIECMEWMYLQGASVEEQDNLGRTPLMWACYQGHPRAVTYLLSRAASVAHRDHEGATSLHWASRRDAKEIWAGGRAVVDWLISVGAVCSG